MKKCSECKQEKPETEFNKNSRKKDRLQTACRICSNTSSKKYYKADPEAHKIRVRRWSAARTLELRKMITALKDNPCSDCGSKFHPVAMDFDHLSDKEYDISRMAAAGFSNEKILVEISKCELVCSNCHRIRTWNRRQEKCDASQALK